MSWNWPTAKCGRRKSSYTLYNNAICATLYVNFSSKSKATNVFPKDVLKSKARDKLFQAGNNFLSRDSKKLFVQRFPQDFNQVRKHVKARNQKRNTLVDFTVLWYDCHKQPPEVFYKKFLLEKFTKYTGNISIRASF